MDDDDKTMIRRAVAHIIDNDPAFNAGVSPYTYGTGNKLMALAQYVASGGPEDIGAQVNVTAAIENAVRALRGSMGRAGCNVGGWNYGAPQASGDLSTAQFAIGGLVAAVSVVPDAADDVLEFTHDFLANSQNPDGGHKYRSCGGQASSHAMTATGLWCYRLAGVAASDERAQASLTWLRDRYQYDRQENWWQNSFYYYLWDASKALTASGDDQLLPEGVFADSVGGVRDPEADGDEGGAEGDPGGRALPTGAACEQDCDCADGECLTELPGGYCTSQGCGGPEDCPGRGVCAPPGQGGESWCLARCGDEEDCRDGYECRINGTCVPLLDDWPDLVPDPRPDPATGGEADLEPEPDLEPGPEPQPEPQDEGGGSAEVGEDRPAEADGAGGRTQESACACRLGGSGEGLARRILPWPWHRR